MSNQNTNQLSVIVALVATVITLTAIIAVMYFSVSIHASGTVFTKTVNCAIYFDNQGQNPATAINWGTLTPSSSLSVTVYLKNTGNTPCNFTISALNWQPQNAANYITFTYNLNGALNTQPNAIIPCTLSESISASISGITDYSYDINIVASG